jgi:hypothetical protein
LHGQKIREHFRPGGGTDLDRHVRGRRLCGVLFANQIDLDRAAQVASGQFIHPTRNRCREQHRLAVLWGKLEDLLDGLLEAHRKHLVGLVQDRDLQFVETE